MTKILYSKPVIEQIKNDIKQYVSSNHETFCLKVISVGNDPASEIYVNNKKKFAQDCGIEFQHIKFEESITEDELINEINYIKNDTCGIDSIIIQLPLPKHINEKNILDLVPPSMDADGFHPQNLGGLILGLPCKISCTPLGVMKLLEYYNIEIEGKNCVVIGRSNMVGKPMAALLTNANGTVTICHSKTNNLKMYTQNADILVVAMGKPEFIDSSYIKEGAVVIDVGIHRKDNGKICGDVLQDEETLNKVSAITPVPGGVGPMTVASLISNTVNYDFK